MAASWRGCHACVHGGGLIAAVRSSLLLEAIRAIDRLIPTRYERHLGLLATRRTDRSVHLARTTAVATVTATITIAIVIAAPAPTTARLASLAARLAARRLIRKALLRVE